MENFVAVSTVQGQFAEQQLRAFLEANESRPRYAAKRCGRRMGFRSTDWAASKSSFTPTKPIKRATC